MPEAASPSLYQFQDASPYRVEYVDARGQSQFFHSRQKSFLDRGPARGKSYQTLAARTDFQPLLKGSKIEASQRDTDLEDSKASRSEQRRLQIKQKFAALTKLSKFKVYQHTA